MRVRNIGPAILAFGILIGAGGCSAGSPTSPLVPSTASAEKGGFIGSGKDATTSAAGGIIGTGQRDTTSTTLTASGGFIGSGN